jgi:hypothetical protein
MIQKINEPISVNLIYDHLKGRVYPQSVSWNNRTYQIKKIGLHHTFRQGKTLYHIFSVVTSTLFLKLRFNSETLMWRLEEISDGEAD